MNEDIEATYHLAAVPLQGKIILFGGNGLNTPYSSYTLSEESHKVGKTFQGMTQFQEKCAREAY